MRRLLVGALAVSLVAAGAVVGVATGQGTGGTVGAGAVGTKTFEVRVKQNQISVNCGRPAPPQCFRRGPRLANVIAGNGAIYDGTTRVGTALFANIVGRKVGRNGTQEVFLATITFDNRTDSISVLGPSTSQGNPPFPTRSSAAPASTPEPEAPSAKAGQPTRAPRRASHGLQAHSLAAADVEGLLLCATYRRTRPGEWRAQPGLSRERVLEARQAVSKWRDLNRRVEGLGLPVTAIVPDRAKLSRDEQLEPVLGAGCGGGIP